MKIERKIKKKNKGGFMIKDRYYTFPTTTYKKDDLLNPLNSFDDFFNAFFGIDKKYIKEKNEGLVNISETENDYKLEFILPGYKKDDIYIGLENNILTIKSDVKKENENKNKTFLIKEYINKSFSRSFTLPDDASDDIKAEMVDGILILTVDKIKKMQNKKVKVIDIK